ncbi:hypothetical protein G9A89_017238 [Geosiphon pyriformis]|nr:hypothetical protein G9A89_017238 [Geosiphon pyriformis]
MALTPIAKLEKFTSEEDNAQTWINDITKKPQNFNAFKIEFLRYFNDNNSINRLASTFTTLKQRDTEAFIRGLRSSILQQVHSMYLVDLPTTVTHARDFEAVELEANYAQALTITQFISLLNNVIIREMQIVSKISHIHHHQQISHGNKKRGSATTVVNKVTLEPIAVFIDHASGVQELGITKTRETNQKSLTHNILPATSTKDKSLAAIFPFELKEITLVPLFNRAILDTKPITTMYTDAKVNDQYIKLILDSGSAGSIITKQLMDQLADGATKTLIGKIDNFSFEVNSIIVPIKVLVIEATQYQALVSNGWLTKINAILDWTMQELQLSQNGQHTCVPVMCDHFKTINTPAPLIEFEKEEKKPTWEAYQDDNNNEKGKQREEHTWRTTIDAWTNNSQTGRKKKKKKKKKKTYLEKSNSQKTQPKDEQAHTPFASRYYSHHLFHLNTKTVEKNSLPWEHELCQIKTTGCKHIITVNHAITNAMDIQSAKTSRTINHVSLVVNSYLMKGCGMTFLVKKEHAMLHATVWHRAINQLDGYPHDEDKIWQMVNAKVQGAMPSEILEVKNNLPEQVDIILIPNPDTFLDIKTNPENFHEHYQNLAPIREEQEEHLA